MQHLLQSEISAVLCVVPSYNEHVMQAYVSAHPPIWLQHKFGRLFILGQVLCDERFVPEACDLWLLGGSRPIQIRDGY